MLEIVTKPEIRSSEEATAFVAKLQRLMRHFAISTANMEEVKYLNNRFKLFLKKKITKRVN